MNPGTLYGIGAGPGDPELVTLKAARILGAVPVVAHFRKRGSPGNGRAIVAPLLRPDVRELPLTYPVTTEIPRHDPAYAAALDAFHDEAAASVAAELDAGRDVAVVSEGDPLFYGSYMHLHVRLSGRFRAVVVPGISAMSAAWSAAGLPITRGDDALAVLMGTLPDAVLEARLASAEAAVVMKLGRQLPRLRAILERLGRLDRAVYAERVGTAAQRVLPLSDHDGAPAPYFSLVLVPGWRGA